MNNCYSNIVILYVHVCFYIYINVYCEYVRFHVIHVLTVLPFSYMLQIVYICL